MVEGVYLEGLLAGNGDTGMPARFHLFFPHSLISPPYQVLPRHPDVAEFTHPCYSPYIGFTFHYMDYRSSITTCSTNLELGKALP